MNMEKVNRNPRISSSPDRSSTNKQNGHRPQQQQQQQQQQQPKQLEVDAYSEDEEDPIVGVRPHPNLIARPSINASIYAPGEFTGNLKSNDDALRLCNGISASLIAQSGERIELHNGTFTQSLFLSQPNGGAVFSSDVGWSYLINSHSYLTGDAWWSGGVGALDFNANGNLIGYRRILSGTSLNNGGGKTPWNTWITCELWSCRQVDPMAGEGTKSSITTTETATTETTTDAIPLLGIHKELSSFAYYNTSRTGTTSSSTSTVTTTIQNTTATMRSSTTNAAGYPWFFISRDNKDGALTRFILNEDGQRCYDSEDKWCTLQYMNPDYLVLNPTDDTFESDDGTFEWSMNLTAASISAFQSFQNANYLSVDNNDGVLYMISKPLGKVICLYLETGLYKVQSKLTDLLAADEHHYFFDTGSNHQETLFFPSHGGISGRTSDDEYFVLLYPENLPSTSVVTGVLSPDGKHLYVVYRESGRIYDVERIDGQPLGSLLELTQSML